MNIDQLLQKGIREAFIQQFDFEPEAVNLQPTRKEFAGSHTLTVFPYTKALKKKPEEIAESIGSTLKNNIPEVADYNVVKGFLNIEITDSTWADFLNDLGENDAFGQFPKTDRTIVLEYSSPNTNKPIHLGHLRNNFLGYAVANILQAAGHRVHKINLINDRGIHICKSMAAYMRAGAEETPESAGMKGDHLVGKYYVNFNNLYKKEIEELILKGVSETDAKEQAPIILEARKLLQKWEAGDTETRALWKKMNEWVLQGFEVTYKKIGVDFQKIYFESETYLLGKEIIEEGLEKGVFYKKNDNSVWIDLTEDGLDKKLLLRADSTSVYITQDLGAAELRCSEFKPDSLIYVVGNEQDYHFKVLRLILKKLGRPYADSVFHLSYGMVDLPSGKMKSREGTVVDADEIIRETIDIAEKLTRELGKIDDFSEEAAEELYNILGLGALKYFLLKIDPKKRILFDPKESVDFQGNTGPFIQYTHARISALLRKSDSNQYLQLPENELPQKLLPSEREIIIHLSKYPEKIQEAAETYSPALIAQYVFDLAKLYNRFYAEVPVLGEPDENLRIFRILLSSVTARTIRSAMKLLGIDVPERM